MTRIAVTIFVLMLAKAIVSTQPIAAQVLLRQDVNHRFFRPLYEKSSVIWETPAERFTAFVTVNGTDEDLWNSDSVFSEQIALTVQEGRATGPGSAPEMGGRGGMAVRGPPGYDAKWYPSRNISGQAGGIGLVRHGLSLGVPIYRDDANMVMSSLSVRNSMFSTDALLPDSLRPFPHQLWSANLGFNYMHQLDNGWSSGLMGGIGSASDEPFQSIDEVTANVGAFLRIPARRGQDSWQLMLMYMHGGQVNFPIPMVSYAWNPSDRLRVKVGLPFSLAWQPAEDLTFDLSYVPLNNIDARLKYRLTPRFHMYFGYEFLNDSYFLADRTDRSDRFFAFEQRLISGLQWKVGRKMYFDLNVGYSFGRSYGEGDSQWGSLSDEVDVASGLFLGTSLRLQF